MECWIDVKANGDVKTSRLTMRPKMPVGPDMEWFIRSRSKGGLLYGLKKNGRHNFQFVPHQGYELYVLISRWDRKKQQQRFTMPGMGFLKGSGIAKKVANLLERHWVVVITTGQKTRTESGWNYIWSTKERGASSLYDDGLSVDSLCNMLYFNKHLQ